MDHVHAGDGRIPAVVGLQVGCDQFDLGATRMMFGECRPHLVGLGECLATAWT